MRAIAPGKLILSGEHAVVYGRPALAMAIDRCAMSVITTNLTDQIAFNLVDLQTSDSFTMRTLSDMKLRVLRSYNLFLEGKLGIRQVLLKPIELFEFAFINILDGLHLKLEKGITIHTESNIPMGCGMGSSAATVLSILRGIGHYFRVDFRPDWVLKYSLEAERLQHGYPSGVDSYISLHGGCALFQNGEATTVPLPRLAMYLVQTGAPDATTGECVVRVADHFKTDVIWNDFEGVTREMERAICANDLGGLRRMVRENHRLLVRIGVVPEKVQSFIRAVEDEGGAAKVCGAGSVVGEKAGVVLVVSHEPPERLCKEYGYTIIPVRGDPLGARII